jgi:hypothetical protein
MDIKFGRVFWRVISPLQRSVPDITHNIHKRQTSMHTGASKPQSQQQASGR